MAYPKDKERWPLAGESLVAGPESSPGAGVPLSGTGGATQLWEDKTPSERMDRKAAEDLRNAAAAKAALETQTFQNNNTIGDLSQNFAVETDPMTGAPRDEVISDPEDAWADYLEQDASKFLDNYDHDRINMVADGRKWDQAERDAAHGYFAKLNEKDPGDWQIVVDGEREWIFQDFDTGQKVSVEKTSGYHHWHSPEDNEKKAGLHE